mgnify:CR=1 FL=1
MIGHFGFVDWIGLVAWIGLVELDGFLGLIELDGFLGLIGLAGLGGLCSVPKHSVLSTRNAHFSKIDFTSARHSALVCS